MYLHPPFYFLRGATIFTHTIYIPNIFLLLKLYPPLTLHDLDSNPPFWLYF